MPSLFTAKNRAMPLELCYYGDPRLRKNCASIATITNEIRELAEGMIQVMRRHEGIGLAAPQVGYNIELVVVEIPVDDPRNGRTGFSSPGEAALISKMPLILINPRVTPDPVALTESSEGCLSIPKISGKVVRPQFVHVEAQLLNGHRISYRCGGLLSRCLQHEFDHLRGVLFIDRLSEAESRRLAPALEELRKQRKIQP